MDHRPFQQKGDPGGEHASVIYSEAPISFAELPTIASKLRRISHIPILSPVVVIRKKPCNRPKRVRTDAGIVALGRQAPGARRNLGLEDRTESERAAASCANGEFHKRQIAGQHRRGSTRRPGRTWSVREQPKPRARLLFRMKTSYYKR